MLDESSSGVTLANLDELSPAAQAEMDRAFGYDRPACDEEFEPAAPAHVEPPTIQVVVSGSGRRYKAGVIIAGKLHKLGTWPDSANATRVAENYARAVRSGQQVA